MNKDEYTFNFFKVDQDEMQRKTRELSRKIIDLIAENNFSELGKLQQECGKMRYSAQGYLEQTEILAKGKDILVTIGYVSALLDAIQMYLKKMSIENEMQQIKTKYKNAVLTVLVKRGTMLHRDLASAIGVSASGLTAIIKQMNAVSVKTVHIESVGKFKLYTITPAAYKYATHNLSELLPEMEGQGGEIKLDYSYAIEMRRKLQSKKTETVERENRDDIECFGIRDKENKKYFETPVKISRKAEFGKKLA